MSNKRYKDNDENNGGRLFNECLSLFQHNCGSIELRTKKKRENYIHEYCDVTDEICDVESFPALK